MHIHIYTYTNTYSAYTERKRLRSFSRPVSSFVTLPSPFSDFLSSADNLFFRPVKDRHGRHGENEKKNKTKQKSESFSRILNASNVIHGQLSSLVRKRYSLASTRYSAVKEKRCVSSVIHTKYIICATIEIYMRNNGSQLIGWRESFEFHPRSPEIFFDPISNL